MGAFSPKQVRILSPFLWHYPAYSPWSSLAKCGLVIIAVSLLGIRLPGFASSTQRSPKEKLVAIERDNALGRPLVADTEGWKPAGAKPPAPLLAGAAASFFGYCSRCR